MSGLFAGLKGFEIFFLLCAAVGGFFVLIRLVLQFVGVGADADIDGDFDVNIDSDHADSDVGFKLLSLHGLTSFLMMFGLVGQALYRQSGAGFFGSLVGACLAGLVSVWAIGRLFAMFDRLQSSGTLPTRMAVGCCGTVYLRIPTNGTGRVTINFHNHLREFDAVTRKDGVELSSGTPIKVVHIHANVLVVEKLNE